MFKPRVLELLGGPNFAAFSTLMADGQPQTQMMWIGHDDDHLLINTEQHRQKAKNVQRDPRVTVLIFDAEDMYSFVEVRGRVVETAGGQVARDHIDTLANKYMGVDRYPYPIQTERVILRITPDRQVIRYRSIGF